MASARILLDLNRELEISSRKDLVSRAEST